MRVNFVFIKITKKLQQLSATIAQMVERLTCNEEVAGSIPAGGSGGISIKENGV